MDAANNSKKYKRGQYPEFPRTADGKLANVLRRKDWKGRPVSYSQSKLSRHQVHEKIIDNEYWEMALIWYNKNTKLIEIIMKRYLRSDWIEEISNFIIRDIALAIIQFNPQFGKTLNSWVVQAVYLAIKRFRMNRMKDLTRHKQFSELEQVNFGNIRPYTAMKDVDNEKVTTPLIEATRIFLKENLHPYDYQIYELAYLQNYADSVIAKYLNIHKTTLNKRRLYITELLLASREKIEEIEYKLINE